MKLLRAIIIVLMFFSAVLPLLSQEGGTSTDNAVNTGDSTVREESVKGGSQDEANRTDTGTELKNPDTAEKTGSVVPEKKEDPGSEEAVKTEGEKKAPSGKKAVSVRKTAKKKNQNKPLVSERKIGAGDLLSIEDGDYKYKRIPGIKLEPEEPLKAELSGTDEEVIPDQTLEETSAEGKGFLGLNRKTADIVARGGLLILILLIFILYRKRSGGARGKSRRKKVLNSYRK